MKSFKSRLVVGGGIALVVGLLSFALASPAPQGVSAPVTMSFSPVTEGNFLTVTMRNVSDKPIASIAYGIQSQAEAQALKQSNHSFSRIRFTKNLGGQPLAPGAEYSFPAGRGATDSRILAVLFEDGSTFGPEADAADLKAEEEAFVADLERELPALRKAHASPAAAKAFAEALKASVTEEQRDGVSAVSAKSGVGPGRGFLALAFGGRAANGVPPEKAVAELLPLAEERVARARARRSR